MMTTTKATAATTSTLAALRGLIPHRDASFAEVLKVAELQATRLHELIGDPIGIHEHHIEGLPRITVHHRALPVSGMSHWNGQTWVITINSRDSLQRQRFTLLHELKHIIDHGSAQRLYRGTARQTADDQAEAAADYFAGCALVGRRELKSAWGNRIQRVEDLAAHFGVSIQAIRVRLFQTGLDVINDKVPTPRCARPARTPDHQQQQFRPVRPRYAGRYA